ncbi:hypothetical protein R3P38DRAFT_3364039 [Favolaschia claudopus]|uniref:Transmembrane protein n=1 Tax=Favolaschia claudopus TaxID=2862362 RepID=A0AAW0AK53_9AGAR
MDELENSRNHEADLQARGSSYAKLFSFCACLATPSSRFRGIIILCGVFFSLFFRPETTGTQSIDTLNRLDDQVSRHLRVVCTRYALSHLSQLPVNHNQWSWRHIFVRGKDAVVVFTHSASTTINGILPSSSSSNSDPRSCSSQASTSSPPPSSNKSGAIAGISVGVATVGPSAAFLLRWLCFHRRNTDARRAGVLEEQLGDGWTMSGSCIHQPHLRRTRHDGVLPWSSSSNDNNPYSPYHDSTSASNTGGGNNNTNTLSHSSRAPSEGGTSSSAPGFAGLGAGSVVGHGYASANAYANRNANSGQERRRRRRGCTPWAGQLSTSSTMSSSSGLAAGAVGSRHGQGQGRGRGRRGRCEEEGLRCGE